MTPGQKVVRGECQPTAKVGGVRQLVGGDGRGLGVGRKSAGEVRKESVPPSMAPVSRGGGRIGICMYICIKYIET
jgi:hypothetical protein